jgi:hypothetical protein
MRREIEDVSVSAACAYPGGVATRIATASRARPPQGRFFSDNGVAPDDCRWTADNTCFPTRPIVATNT